MVKQDQDPVSHPQYSSNPISSTAGSSAKIGPFSSFSSINYRWFWLSGFAAGFTMQMRQISRGWLVYRMSQSPLALAFTMASFGVPMTFFSPVGGALADRLPKRTLIFVSNMLSGLSSLVVAILISQNLIQLWHLFVIGFLDGILNAFNMPSRQSIIPSLVARERLVNAIALSVGAMNVSRIAAPAMAGVMIPWIGLGGVYSVMALLNVVAAVTIVAITVSGTESQEWKDWNLSQEVFNGLKYVATNRALLSVLLLAFVAIVLGMGFQVLLPAFVVEALDGDARDLGNLMAFSGVGAMLGSLGLAFMGNPLHKGRILLSSISLWAVAVLMFSVSRNSALASCMLLIVGFATSVFMSMNMAIMQLLSSKEMYGRVMSISMMTWGLMPLGIIPLSALAGQVGTPNALAASAVALVVVSASFPIFNKTVRQLKA